MSDQHDDVSDMGLSDAAQAHVAEVLQDEFIDECLAKLDQIGKRLEDLFQEQEAPEKIISDIQELTFDIKAQSRKVGMPAVGILTHRLEEYLSTDSDLGRSESNEIYLFFDEIKTVLERGGDQPGEDELSHIIRSLPVRMDAEKIVGDRSHIEVLLVMPKNIQRRLIGEEIKACGFHISEADSVFQGIEMAALTKPDLILASAVLDHLDGAQFAHMVRAMKATTQTPFILITSFSDREKQRVELPGDVMIARKGQEFPGDFSESLEKIGLLDRGAAA